MGWLGRARRAAATWWHEGRGLGKFCMGVIIRDQGVAYGAEAKGGLET